MVDAVWEHLLPGSRHRHGDPGRRSPLPGLVAILRWASALVALVLLGWGLVSEARPRRRRVTGSAASSASIIDRICATPDGNGSASLSGSQMATSPRGWPGVPTVTGCLSTISGCVPTCAAAASARNCCASPRAVRGSAAATRLGSTRFRSRRRNFIRNSVIASSAVSIIRPTSSEFSSRSG